MRDDWLLRLPRHCSHGVTAGCTRRGGDPEARHSALPARSSEALNQRDKEFDPGVNEFERPSKGTPKVSTQFLAALLDPAIQLHTQTRVAKGATDANTRLKRRPSHFAKPRDLKLRKGPLDPALSADHLM